MTRSTVFMACLLGIISIAVGDDHDAVKDMLFASKKSYDAEMTQVRKKVGEWLDQLQDAASKAGNKKEVDEILAERKAFEQNGDLPNGVPTDILQARSKAKKTLEAAYALAVSAYTKNKMRDEAASVEKEWNEINRATGGPIVDLLTLREILFASKKKYDSDMSLFHTQVNGWLDKREGVATKAGNKKKVDEVLAERKAFEQDGDLPNEVPNEILQIRVKARKTLESAYTRAVSEYTKNKMRDEAAAVEKEWKEIEKTVGDRPLDLLTLVDTKSHAIVGVWIRDKNAIIGAGEDKRGGLLQIPYQPSREYDIEVRFERTRGYGQVFVGLVRGGQQVGAAIDQGPAPLVSGLIVDGKGPRAGNVTTVNGALLKNAGVNTVTCAVRDGSINVAVNGKSAFTFKGDSNRLSSGIEKGVLLNEKVMFLGTGWGTEIRFDQVMIKPVKGFGKVLK